ncbi:DUF1559 domain-containing protein [Planctomicrobium sp. SH668]|uniref:DUF1559 family PulG-like putative transporter n=1 Tax=Planctomicrobium sp. SH668 TaxID=3448126 RepID=UPI003F5C01A8
MSHKIVWALLASLCLHGCGNSSESVAPPPPPAASAPPNSSAPAVATAPAGAPTMPPPGAPSGPIPSPSASPSGAGANSLSEQIKAAIAAPRPTGGTVDRMKRIGDALFQFELANKHLPALDASGQPNSPQGLSWRVYLLPQLGETLLFQQFKLNEPWDSPHNSQLIERMPPVYGSNPAGMTRIHVFTGPGAPFQNGIGPKLREFEDGLGNSLMLVEAAESTETPWTQPTGLIFNPENAAAALGDIGNDFLGLTGDNKIKRIPANASYLSNLITNKDHQLIPGEFHDEKLIVRETGKRNFVDPLPPANTSKLDWKYTPADTKMILSIQTRKIIESPFVQSSIKSAARPGENVNDVLRRASSAPGGADVQMNAIEEIRMTSDLNFGGGMDFLQHRGELPDGLTTVRMRSSIPFDLVYLLDEFKKGATPPQFEEIQGVPTVLIAPLTSMAFLSDREYVIARTATLKDLIAKRESETTGVAAITAHQGAPDRTITLTADLSGIDLNARMTEMGPAGGMVKNFLPGLMQTNTMQLVVDLMAPQTLELIATIRDASQSGSTATALNGFIAQGKQAALAQMSQLPASNPTASLQKKFTEEFFASLNASGEGDRVLVRLNRLPSMDELPPLVGPAVELANRRQMSRPGAPLAPIDEPSEIEFAENPLMPVAAGLIAYNAANGYLPKPNNSGERTDKNTSLSWRVHLLPFIGEADLYAQFKMDERWDSKHNKTLIEEMPAIFGDSPEGKTRVHVILLRNAIFSNNALVSLAAIKDPLDERLLLIEAGEEKSDFWTKPGGLLFDQKDVKKCLGTPDDPELGYLAVHADATPFFIPAEIAAGELTDLLQVTLDKDAMKKLTAPGAPRGAGAPPSGGRPGDLQPAGPPGSGMPSGLMVPGANSGSRPAPSMRPALQ